MPLVRIDIDASTSQEVRGTICNAVYDAMTSTARVPAHDKFMVVSEHGAGDLVFPQEGYLGIKYTPGIVFIQITWNAGRTTDVKKAFYKKVAEDIRAKDGMSMRLSSDEQDEAHRQPRHEAKLHVLRSSTE